MQHDITAQADATFVCRSNLHLQEVCHYLQVHYHLPVFRFDEHSQWEYARAIGDSIGFNVTKTEQLDQIAQWIEGIPENVNYQIILYLDQTNMINTAIGSAARLTIENVYAFLKDVFATNVLWVGHH